MLLEVASIIITLRIAFSYIIQINIMIWLINMLDILNIGVMQVLVFQMFL